MAPRTAGITGHGRPPRTTGARGIAALLAVTAAPGRRRALLIKDHPLRIATTRLNANLNSLLLLPPIATTMARATSARRRRRGSCGLWVGRGSPPRCLNSPQSRRCRFRWLPCRARPPDVSTVGRRGTTKLVAQTRHPATYASSRGIPPCSAWIGLSRGNS